MCYLCKIDLEFIAKETIDNFKNADFIYGDMIDGNITDFKKYAEDSNEGIISSEELKSKVKVFGKKYN